MTNHYEARRIHVFLPLKAPRVAKGTRTQDETLKKVEKVRRSNVSQTSVKPNTGPSAWTHHNGHKNCEAELAQKTKSRHLPLVLKNRFDSLLTVKNEDKIATCRALCV
ncbi:hypothetical protein Bca4012_091688 [Brassica carinata]